MKPSNYIVIAVTAFFSVIGIYSSTKPYVNSSMYSTNLDGHRDFVKKIVVYQTVRQGGSSNYTSTDDYSSSSSSSSYYSGGSSSSSYDYSSDDDRDYSGGGSSYGK